MTVEEIAAAISSIIEKNKRIHTTEAVLDALIALGQVAPYSTIAPLAGYHHRDRKFHQELGRISRDDLASGRGARSSVVVNKQTNRPGGEYYQLLIDCGIAFENNDLGRQHAWEDQLRKLGIVRHGTTFSRLDEATQTAPRCSRCGNPLPDWVGNVMVDYNDFFKRSIVDGLMILCKSCTSTVDRQREGDRPHNIWELLWVKDKFLYLLGCVLDDLSSTAPRKRWSRRALGDFIRLAEAAFPSLAEGEPFKFRDNEDEEPDEDR
jgi:hypothetical protein